VPFVASLQLKKRLEQTPDMPEDEQEEYQEEILSDKVRNNPKRSLKQPIQRGLAVAHTDLIC